MNNIEKNKKMKPIWIARDNDGSGNLCLFNQEPILDGDSFIVGNGFISILSEEASDDVKFPEIKAGECVCYIPIKTKNEE